VDEIKPLQHFIGDGNKWMSNFYQALDSDYTVIVISNFYLEEKGTLKLTRKALASLFQFYTIGYGYRQVTVPILSAGRQ
jgi:hypothetical protein